jgi:hypothetical protein
LDAFAEQIESLFGPEGLEVLAAGSNKSSFEGQMDQGNALVDLGASHVLAPDVVAG